MSNEASFPVLDPESLPAQTATTYPEEFRNVVDGREVRGLGDALGLRNFGVNLITLRPGAASAQRHWHSHEDEFVLVVDGTLTLVMNAGERVLGPGMVAGFVAGTPDGHCFVNRGTEPASFLVVGDRLPQDDCHYPDVDLHMKQSLSANFTRKDGSEF
jgi:uncharacterized cupin superfamily protein